MFKLSLTKWIEDWKAKKKQDYVDALAMETGLYFSEEIKSEEQGFPWMKYIVNAMALFGSVYGAIGCLVSSFHLKVANPIVVAACAILALLFSFMYVGKKLRVLSYVLVLVASFILVSNYYFVINSGVSAIHNICLNTIDDIFDLPQLREYTEFYTNQYVSMTMALCVMALLMTLVLNIFISEFMNPVAVMAITMPFAMFGMYFMFLADSFPMICLVGSWLLVFCVKNTNSYNGLTRKMKTTSSVKKHKHNYGFVTDSQNVAKIAVVMLSFIMFLTVSLYLVIPQRSFTMDLPTNVVKEKTNQGVKNFLSYGFSAFFSRSSQKSTPGEIDNNGKIMFDGQTDFEVSLVDYGENRMYFRDFVGSTYLPGNFKWIYDVRLQNSNDSSEKKLTYRERSEQWKELYNLPGDVFAYDYENQQAITTSKHKIRFNIIDSEAVGKNLLVPYYSTVDLSNVFFLSDGEIKRAANQDEYELQFYSQDKSARNSAIADIYQSSDADELRLKNKDYYESYVLDKAYTSVPTPNQEVIDEFIEKNHIITSDKDVVYGVVNALSENFDYTLQPGKVPYGEDFVNYFLSSSHKGYCVHFASAATLIFRRLGIPARYVEGYVLDAENYDMATDVEGAKAENWLEGVDVRDATVENIPVTDANGHAWVEIYEKGLGWVPVEVTEAQSIDDEGGFGLLGDFFGGGGRVNSATEEVMNQVSKMDVASTKKNVIRFLVLVCVFLLFLYGVYVWKKTRARHKAFASEDMAIVISNRYLQLCHILELKYDDKVSCKTYAEFIELLHEQMEYDTEKKRWLHTQIEYVIFAGDSSVDAAVAQPIVEELKLARKQIVKNLSVVKKFRYFFVDVIW